MNTSYNPPKYNGAPCAYFDGVFNYFNSNEVAYHSKFKDQKWNGPCAENMTYTVDMAGSIQAYRTLLDRSLSQNYQIILYNGDWDDVVPYYDTIKSLKTLNLHHVHIN